MQKKRSILWRYSSLDDYCDIVILYLFSIVVGCFLTIFTTLATELATIVVVVATLATVIARLATLTTFGLYIAFGAGLKSFHRQAVLTGFGVDFEQLDSEADSGLYLSAFV